MNVWSRAGSKNDTTASQQAKPEERRGEEKISPKSYTEEENQQHHLPPSSHMRLANSCLCRRGERGGSGAVIARLNPLNPSCTKSRKSMKTTEDEGQQPHRERFSVCVCVEGGWYGKGKCKRRRVMEEEEERYHRSHSILNSASSRSVNHSSLSPFPSSSSPPSGVLLHFSAKFPFLLQPASIFIHFPLFPSSFLNGVF